MRPHNGCRWQNAMGGLRIKRADALALVGKDDFAVARHRVVAERALVTIACLRGQHALALHQVVFKRALVAVAIQGLAAFAVAQIVFDNRLGRCRRWARCRWQCR